MHLLASPGLPRAGTRALRDMVERRGASLTLHELDERRTRDLPGWEYIPAEMWFRVFLGELLPEVERVLYLDCDTIVVDSLAPLAELGLGNAYVAAVRNLFLPGHADRPARIGLPPDQPYFNSGVLLLNLDAMRRDDCQTELLELARCGKGRLLFPDQDALNIVLGRRLIELHPRWNVMNSFLVFPWAREGAWATLIEEAASRPAIRHYEGPGLSKPWHFLYSYPDREAYFDHRAQTPWPHVRREGLTLRNAILRVEWQLRRRGRWPPPRASD